jgi:hypothetical protein
MRRTVIGTLLGLLLTSAAAWAADDAGSAPVPDEQWPPKPVPGLQFPIGSSAVQSSPSLVPQPGPPAPDTYGNSAPSSVTNSLPPAAPFKLPDGNVIPSEGGVVTIFDAGAPLPDWSFSADALWLQRTIGTDNRLGGVFSYNTHHFIDHLDSDDAGFSMQPGMRLQLIRHLDDQIAWEGIYYGLQSWSGGRTLNVDPVGANTVAFSPYTQTDALIGGFGTSLGYTDRSSLQNFELNQTYKRMDFGNWRWGTLWGLRYLNFSDRLNINGVDAFYPAYENLDLSSTNNMLGAQIGAQWQRDWNRFHLQMTGKLGLMANIIHLHESNLNSSGYLNGSPPGFFPFQASATRTGLAGVLDFSTIATYQVRQNIVLRAGYQLLYVPGVSLAPDQLDGYVHQNGVFMHGPMAGLELRW